MGATSVRWAALAAIACAMGACSSDNTGLKGSPIDLDGSAGGGAPDADVSDDGPGGGAGGGGKAALGGKCAAAGDCESGFCVDGVCCNAACTGSCMGCAQPGKSGLCSPVGAGAKDPRGVCKDQGAASCGQSGLCNGQGGCARYASGAVCRPPACQNGSLMPAGTCDGNGTCVAGAPISCDPYVCAAGACKDNCQSASDCVAPATCNAGSCGKRGLGQTCKSAGDCLSGFCADGVCCNEACGGKCRFCALPIALGRCVNVPVDAPDPRAAAGVTDTARICVDQGAASCGTNGRCSGTGSCQRYEQGTPCAPESCDVATNGYNPPSACSADGRCVARTPINCAPFRCAGARCAATCTADGDCVPPATCQNGSCGRKSIGQVCAVDGDCASGHCAQGVCCISACGPVCASCALPGSLGVCTPLSSGAPDPSNTCKDQGAASCGTDGTCNGAGACRKYPAGATCAPATCAAGKVTAASTCNASATCQAGATRVCDPYLCNAAGTDCYNSCTDNTQCIGGAQCQQGRCGKKGAGAPCTTATECASGFCADGVCCNTACAGTCVSCALGGATGTCTPIPAGMTDPDGSCGPVCSADMLLVQDRKCDGNGACAAAGPATSCNDYLCRQAACLTTCAGAGDCAPGSSCSNGACVPTKKANGASCADGTECQSGNCVDKTCCSSASCATCSTCANAAGQCAPTTAGTPCGAITCSGDMNSTVGALCDGSGTCKQNVTTSCNGYVCSGGACKTSCTRNADCAGNSRCRGGKCR